MTLQHRSIPQDRDSDTAQPKTRPKWLKSALSQGRCSQAVTARHFWGMEVPENRAVTIGTSGLPGLLGCGCRNGKKDEVSLPWLHWRNECWATKSSPDGCRQLSAPHCLSGKRGRRKSGKIGKIGIEGEGVHLKGSPWVCRALKQRLRAAGRSWAELSCRKCRSSAPAQADHLPLLPFFPLPRVSAREINDDYLPAALSPSLPLSPGSITNKSPRWERGPEETRGTKPQTEPFFFFFFPPALPSSSAFH